MEIKCVEGIVLSSVKYKDNSKILNCLTKEHGLIGIISKGCLNIKSKNRSVSENFTYANFQIYYKENGISTLKEADIIDPLLNIRSDIEKYGYLNYLCDLTKNVYKENNSLELFDILKSALLKINEGFNPKVITNIVEIKYLPYLGVGLNLCGCVRCGEKNVVNISSNLGGYVCARHLTNEKKHSLNAIKMFKGYFYVDISKISELKIKKEVIDEIDNFLNIYYKEYTGLYLKSKSFLNSVTNF